MAKTNLTLQLDEDVIRRARIVAAKRGTSVSALVARELDGLVAQDERYEQAWRRAEELMAGVQQVPLPAFSRATASAGFVDWKFNWQVCRSIPLLLEYEHRLYPQFGLVVACRMLEVNPADIRVEDDRYFAHLQVVEARLHDHLAGEFHPGRGQVELVIRVFAETT